MLRNKLKCLEHPNPDGVNVNDEKQFRNLLLWLEEQKIRHYKIEDRGELRKINKDSWLQAFDKYKNDLSCPTELITKLDQLKWIVGYAVKLEYLDNGKLIFFSPELMSQRLISWFRFSWHLSRDDISKDERGRTGPNKCSECQVCESLRQSRLWVLLSNSQVNLIF